MAEGNDGKTGKSRRSVFSALGAKFRRTAARRHIFLCAGPDCCSPDEGNAAFRRLREGVRRAGLDEGEDRVACTKTGCLGVCGNGPVAVVYPEAVWYETAGGEALDRIVDRHLREGETVTELSFEPPPDARPPAPPVTQ